MWWRPRGASPGLCRSALLAAICLAPGACTSPDEFAPACPHLSFLPDGADMTRFNGRGHDVTDTVVKGHLTAVPASCRWANSAHSKVEATLSVAMSLDRGPAIPGRDVSVPYFVAVTENGRVLDRQEYTVEAAFPPNTDRVTGTGEQITLDFPVTPQKSAAAYQIWVSFQLTPDELAWNRRAR